MEGDETSLAGVTSDINTSSTDKMDATTDDYEQVDTHCGYNSSCKPAWLQRFANPKVYLVLISLCSIVQGFAVNGINNVNISSYERRYLLTSSQSGLVASFYDIAAGLSVIFVGYFGATTHQPRILGVAVLSLGLGTLTMSMAHFIAPSYEPGSSVNSTLTCNLGVDEVKCLATDSQAFLKNYLYILLLGQALNGFGGTCLYTLGVTYLDESVSTKLSPLYISIMSGSSVLGPAVGYILGGYLLEIYVNPSVTPPEGLKSTDPAWVGAWWLGFVVSSILSFSLAAFMFLFPKELPGTKAVRAEKVSQAHDNGTEEIVNAVGFGLSWKDMPRATWFLLKNPTYMCVTAVVGVELILAAGMSTFLPKLIANQFAQTVSWSSMLTGFMAVPGAFLGQLTGGYLCKRFQLKVPGMLKLAFISSCVVLLATPVVWARCSDSRTAGVAVGYPGSTEFDRASASLDSTCNTGCGCNTEVYDPVCADGVQYFSPCHAGCLNDSAETDDGQMIFTECSCPSGVAPSHDVTNQTTVIRGPCEVSCSLLYPVFVPFAFILFFGTFVMGSPLTVATLRVVPEKQRAFAVAVQWVFLRFLGSIPGPIIFGAMIDSSCSLWEETCGVQGSCWIYNSYTMSFRLFILMVVLKIVSIIFNALSFIVYKPPPERQELSPVEMPSANEQHSLNTHDC